MYVVLLVLLSIGFSSVVAKTTGYRLFEDTAALLIESVSPTVETAEETENFTAPSLAPSPMFTTIIQGADEEVGCSNNGFTVAR